MGELERKKLRYERFIKRTEVPMLILSFILVPVVLMPFIEDLSAQSQRALQIIGVAIWTLFAAEYAVMVFLSPHRFQTIVTHKLDLAVVLLPFLRPARFARIFRLIHSGAVVSRSGIALNHLTGRPGFTTTIGTVSGSIIAGGTLVTIAEHGRPGSTISNFGDGLWWAFVTCTTVGYGDTFPVTSTGRITASVLMLAGISGLSVISANIAAYFVAIDSKEEVDELVDRLGRIEANLERLTNQLPTNAEDEKPASADANT